MSWGTCLSQTKRPYIDSRMVQSIGHTDQMQCLRKNPATSPSHKEGNRRPYILYLSICNVYKGLISGSYIGSVLTTDMMPAFCSLTLATASGILGVPCGTALIHPLGRRRMTPLGVESCVWAHTIHYIMHTESRMSRSMDQEIQVSKSS